MAVIDDGALEAVDCQRAALDVLKQPLVHVINNLGSMDNQVATARLPILLAAVYVGTGNCSSKIIHGSFFLQ